jgi:hypothetical protein
VKLFRWEGPPRSAPKHPYRDSAAVYAVLAVLVVVVTALTGGDVPRAIAIASAIFVVATGYTWWRWRGRLRREEEGE